MGMIACYMGVDVELLNQLKTKNAEELFDEVEVLAEDQEGYDMDKMWDGLHFLLTGSSATEPVKDNLLSEAIVGSKVFCEEDDVDYIAYIYPQQIKAILKAMDEVDIDKMLVDFSPKTFAASGIYPAIWMKEEKETLCEELKTAYLELKEFYQEMVSDEMGVIVSIY